MQAHQSVFRGCESQVRERGTGNASSKFKAGFHFEISPLSKYPYPQLVSTNVFLQHWALTQFTSLASLGLAQSFD